MAGYRHYWYNWSMGEWGNEIIFFLLVSKNFKRIELFWRMEDMSCYIHFNVILTYKVIKVCSWRGIEICAHEQKKEIIEALCQSFKEQESWKDTKRGNR